MQLDILKGTSLKGKAQLESIGGVVLRVDATLSIHNESCTLLLALGYEPNDAPCQCNSLSSKASIIARKVSMTILSFR